MIENKMMAVALIFLAGALAIRIAMLVFGF